MTTADFEQLKIYLDEHLAHKEAVASKNLFAMREEIKDLTDKLTRHIEKEEAHNQRVEEMLTAWTNAKGFIRVSKWLIGILIGIGTIIGALKTIGIKILIK